MGREPDNCSTILPLLGEGRGEAVGLFVKRMPIDCSEIL